MTLNDVKFLQIVGLYNTAIYNTGQQYRPTTQSGCTNVNRVLGL